MDQELTKEEIDRRARELARRVMSMPPKPRVKVKVGAEAAPENDAGKAAQDAAGSDDSQRGRSGRVLAPESQAIH